MKALPVPTQTPKALRGPGILGAENDQVRRALLSNIDEHRKLIELETFAFAMGLESDALERLRRAGSSIWRTDALEARCHAAGTFIPT
jgi:hypothetical protein